MDLIVVTRILNSLNLRRKHLDENEKGFTLIELLVVVIIIGILAAIAIPVYLGVQNNAKDAGVKSDLANAKTAIIAIQTNTGALPASGLAFTEAAMPGITAAGFTKGNDTTTISYFVGGTAAAPTFCIGATSSTTSKFYVTDSKGAANNATTAAPVGCTF